MLLESIIAIFSILLNPCWAASFTTSPSVTSIHENADDQKLIWTVSATCYIKWDCTKTCYAEGNDTNVNCNNCSTLENLKEEHGDDVVVSNTTCPDGLDGRCNETVICNSCTLDNNPDVLIMEGNTIYKKNCTSNACLTGGTPISYRVTCTHTDTEDRQNFEFDSVNKTVTLNVALDSTPSIYYKRGSSIAIGKSIAGTGQLVNMINSTYVDETDDKDSVTFFLNSSANPSWLELNTASGAITVNSTLASEAETSHNIEFCVKNRRNLTNCSSMSITIYGTEITNSPYNVSLHENTDAAKDLWDVNGTVDVTYRCFDIYTCSELSAFDHCLVNDSGVDLVTSTGSRVFKRECKDKLCDECDITQHCVDKNETYPYTVTCSKSYDNNYPGFTTGFASKSASVTFYADKAPSFEYEKGNATIVFKNNSVEGTVINKIVSDPVDEPDDNDRLNYSLKTPPRPSWIHANILFDLDRVTGEIKVNQSLEKEFSYTFEMETCITNRRQFKVCKKLSITLWGCYQTPNCSNQVILDLKDTHGIDGHESNNSLFQNESPPPTGHFTDFRPTWAQLNWYLDNGNFGEAAINKTSGEIYLTTNISIWPSYPSRNYNMTVTVENTESCYTSTCNMEVTILYTNWPLHIASLLDKNEREISLHEDVDEETLLHELKVYDYNYERSSDGHNIEDNATCWIKEVFDQWGDNDTELFELKMNSAKPHQWDAYSLWKRKCTVQNSPFTPPCGFKRDNYTCPKHSGCMTHNVTQWYNVSITCKDGYGETDNKNFTFFPLPNEAPTWRNLPNEVTLDLNTGSEHDVIFSTMYQDAEKENLTYEYQFLMDNGSAVTYFKGDSSGNYYDQLGNISLTTFLKYVPKNSTYHIQICGHDRRNEICEILTVKLQDYCGSVPVCTGKQKTVTEETPIGSEIFDISTFVTNLDSFSEITYSLTAKHLDLFVVDQANGKVTTATKLPASYPSTAYSLNGFVSDKFSCQQYSVCPLKLYVTYVNYAPTIGNLPANVSIHEDENTPLTLFTVETFDSNADDEITCYITNPNDNLPFYEEETFSGSGVYVIKNHVAGTDSSRQLSSAKTTYTIDITCEDRLGVNDTGTLTINVVLNTGPNLTTIVGTVNKQVDQSVVFSGATLLTEEASDQENDALNYTCTVDSTNNPLTCFIEGNIITIQLRRNVSIDRENGLIFSIGVCVGDEKHYNNDCGTLVITFETTHAYPSISNLPATKNVSEGTPIGTVLFTAIVADDDLPNESHVFSMSVVPSTAIGHFTLDPTSGAVTLTKVLDFETLNKYTLFFTVRDNYLSSKESYVLLINVTNVNEGNTLTSSVSSINFKESAKVGRKFKTGLSCSDVDHEDTTTISLASGTHVDYFVYNVSDNRLYLTKEWDLDDSSLGLPSTTTLTFRCTDAGGLFSEHDIVVNVEHVNDMKPTFTFTLGESETTSAGKPFLKINRTTDLSTKFLTVECVDADADDDGQCRADILGNGLGKKLFEFRADAKRKRSTSNAMSLYLRQIMDFNYNVEFTFNIKVTDNSKQSLFSALAITVNYTALVSAPEAADVTSSLTSSKTGRTLIGVLITECVIVFLLAIHFVWSVTRGRRLTVSRVTNMPNNTRFKTRPSFKIAIEGQPDLETTNFMTNQKRLQTSSRQRQSEFSKLSRFDTDSDSSTENEPEIRMQRSRRRLQGGTRHSFTNLPSDQMFSDLPMPLYSSDVQGCLPGSVEDVKQLY